MKKYLTLFFAITLLVAGCADDKHSTEPEPEEQPDPEIDPDPSDNPYKTGVDMSLASLVDWDYGETDRYFLLGYGYDATGRFAHPGFVRKKVLDIDVLEKDRGDVVTIIRANSSQSDYYFWGGEQECRKDFSEHADFSDEDIAKYPNLFKQALTPVFDNDNVFPELEYTYYGCSSVVTYFSMRFLWSLRWHSEDYLTEEFRSDLSELSADEIIETYGTHMITGLKKGSRLDFYYRSTSSDIKDIHTWFTYYSNYYLNLRPAPRKPDIEPPLKDNIYYEFVYGAKPEPNAFLIDILNYEGGRFVFEEMNNLEEEKSTLVGFNQKLVPVYELVIDPVKKEELKNAWNRYLGAAG